MNKSIVPVWFLLLGASVLLLTGCALSQPADLANDPMSLVPEAIAAQNGAEIRLQPSEQQLHVGDTTTVEIQIDNIAGMTAADIKLQFNPNVLQVQDADSNKDGIQIQPGNFPSPDLVVANVVTNTTGIVHYALIQIPPTKPVNGSGLLAALTLQATASGNSRLIFSMVNLADNNGQFIPVTVQSGQITVGQVAASPTATSTPATATPTASPTIPGSTPTSIPPTPSPSSTPLPSPSPSPIPLPSPTPLPNPTPIPPVTDIPPGATIGFCYRVQEGDTLYSIGQEFGMDPHFINMVNDLHPPGYVFPNQALFVPEQHGYGPNVYIVRASDTLAGIAEACHLPVSFLAQVNDLDQTAIVQEGHVLLIPIPPFPPPSRFQYSPQNPPFAFMPSLPAPAVSPGSCDYIVQPGDTLYSIGRRYDISLDALVQINSLDNPNHIYTGQCLILSGY